MLLIAKTDNVAIEYVQFAFGDRRFGNQKRFIWQ